MASSTTTAPELTREQVQAICEPAAQLGPQVLPFETDATYAAPSGRRWIRAE